MKKLERKIGSVRDDINLLQITNGEGIDSYGEERTGVRMSIEKVAKGVPSNYVRMMMCKSRVDPKWCTRATLK